MGFLGLIVALFFLAGPIIAVVALVRSARLRPLEDRFDDLQRRLREIESRLDAAGRARVPVEPEPAASPPPPPPIPTPEPPPLPIPDLVLPPPRVPTPAMPVPEMPPPDAVPIDWERWIGIRGAAVLGAVALSLAGMLFFRYSIEHGLITPLMRFVLGTITGLSCLVGSEWLRGRGYRQTSEGVSGAGIVILYAAFWAALVLYDLIPMMVAFALMALVTVTCCLLAVRHSSLLVAVLGLAGGFATPLLLSSGSDRPIGLFGYVLLLDLGLLAVGHKRRWPSLGILSLLGTALIEALWIGARMGPDRLLFALGILVLFALLFLLAGRFAGREAQAGAGPASGWLWSRIGSLAFPFAFAIYFAARVELGPRLYPIAILLALLCAGACWLAREQSLHSISVAAAAASLAVVMVWLSQHPLTPGMAWETAAAALGLSAIFHLFVERDRPSAGLDGPAPAAMASVGGFFALTIVAGAATPVEPWPWLVAWSGLTILLYRHAAFPDRADLQSAAALGLGLGLSILHNIQAGGPHFPPPAIFLALMTGFAIALHLAALPRRQEQVRSAAFLAAAALPVLLLLGMLPGGMSASLTPALALGTSLVLGALAALASARLGKGGGFAAAVAATWLVHTAWTSGRIDLKERPSEIAIALLLQAAAVVLFSLWPVLAARTFSADRVAWYAAALAGPLWFLPMKRLFEWRFGNGFIGILPVALGALALLAAQRVRRAWPEGDPIRRSALVWFAAVALSFVSVAIPLQLEKEWITIGWALNGLAVIALWKRLDHAGLKYFGLALLAAATARLVANPELLGYYPRPSIRIVNWLLYTYAVPAAALLASAALLKPLETDRARAWESEYYARGHPIGAIGAGLASILVVFVWINLAIAEWFATGEALTLRFGDRPGQRLAVSIAWGIYALVLLGLGMTRKSVGLRWISLGFLLITIGKVFLHDLGALRDLYRVGALVGLAVSLILVSLLYQRFVFAKDRAAGS